MKLKNIKICNLFQYEDLETSFSGNLVGIVGKNGTGKSNFLNSLHFAFAGEVPGKTKEQVLRWGAESGYVRVEFEHEGQTGSIERHVPGVKAVLKLGDEKFTGIKAVNAAVLEKLGMDKDIFRLVFVKQAELDSILFDQASRREVAFQRMCGLGDASRLHRNLKDLIASVFNETDGDLEAAIAVLEEEKEKSEKELAETKLKVSELAKKLEDLGPEAFLEAEIEKYSLASRLKYALQVGKDAYERNKKELERLRAEKESLSGFLDDETLKNAKDELANSVNELQKWEMFTKTFSERAERFETNRMTIATIETESKEFENLEELERSVEEESKSLAFGRSLAGLYQSAIDATKELGHYSTCPLCGSRMSEDVLTSFKMRLAECHTDSSKLDELKKNLVWQRRRMAELSGKLSALYESVQGDENWLRENSGKLQAGELEQMREAVSQMRQFVDDAVGKSARAKQVEWGISRVESDIGNHIDSEEKCRKQLEERGISPDMTHDEAEAYLTGYKERLSDYNKVYAEHRSAAGLVYSLETRIRGIEKNLEETKAKLANTETREKTRNTLLAVADWLHYSNGPHKLSAKILSVLTDDTNRFLETLDSPFSVSVDPETLGYLFSMNDGSGPETPQPAETLSGGQKVLLAVAFRLASYCMFAGKYGLMALDEPTAYLDDANVANFCTLLDSIKSMAASMDLQILISTHERAVLPYLDSVLDIDKAKA